MFTNKVEVLNMARAMAAHAAARQVQIARNVANADTPGYRARQLPAFAEVWEGRGQAMRATRAGHAGFGSQTRLTAEAVATNLSPNGNSVSVEAEMLAAAQVRQEHDWALAIHRTLSGSIRAALGRR
jgi:flagellar basal-body rod protein FlgB